MKTIAACLLMGCLILAGCSEAPIEGKTCDAVLPDNPRLTKQIVGSSCYREAYCVNIIKLENGGSRNKIRTLGATTIVRVYKPAVLEVTIDDVSTYFLVNERAAIKKKAEQATCAPR